MAQQRNIMEISKHFEMHDNEKYYLSKLVGYS